MCMYNQVVPLFVFILVNPLQASLISSRNESSLEACLFSARKEVHIINNIPSKSSLLHVHCGSGNDDLGIHDLDVGQDYNWGFCKLLFGETVFKCNFAWGDQRLSFTVFDNEVAKKCSKCYYRVKPGGFYLVQGDGEIKVASW